MNSAVAVACSLAERLPAADLRALTDATVAGRGALEALRASAAGSLLRRACDELLDVLPACSEQFLAGALAAAAESVRQRRLAESVDIVWTGPASGVNTSRLTAGSSPS